MSKQKEVQIKYDMNSMKILKVTAIVATILFAVAIVLMNIEIGGTELFMLFALYIGGGLAVTCYLSLGAGHLYMNRLKKYGYAIPDNKSNYDGKIENLPRINSTKETSIFSAHSKWSAIACICIFIAFLALDVQYYFRWKFMKDDCKSVFVLCFLFYLIWIIFAIALKKQSNRYKYRDDVEIDTTRKERWSLEQILFTMIVLCLLSFFTNYTAHSITKYIFNAWVEHDMVQADIVSRDILSAIEECQDENGAVKCKETYAELCEGIDITTWGVPKDELQTLIAKNMNIDDFSFMRDDFRVSDGDARIFVKITDEKVTVRLLNPVKELSLYSLKYKEIYVDSEYITNTQELR